MAWKFSDEPHHPWENHSEIIAHFQLIRSPRYSSLWQWHCSVKFSDFCKKNTYAYHHFIHYQMEKLMGLWIPFREHSKSGQQVLAIEYWNGAEKWIQAKLETSLTISAYNLPLRYGIQTSYTFINLKYSLTEGYIFHSAFHY